MNTLEHGQYYHIYNRGINGCKIFRNEKDYSYFLALYLKFIDPIGEIIAYCLIPNHFHLLIKIKEEKEIGFIDTSERPSEKEKWFVIVKPKDELLGNNKFHQLLPSLQFSHLFNAYSKYFNKKHKRTGSLFEKNFHRIKLDSESYIRQLILYIHFNPVKHGITNSIEKYLWSSYHLMVKQKCSNFQKQIIEDRFDGLENFILCHKGSMEFFDNDDMIHD